MVHTLQALYTLTAAALPPTTTLTGLTSLVPLTYCLPYPDI